MALNIDLMHEVVAKSLLGRDQVKLDEGDLEDFYKGQRILITGAGGSIGSEIARQVLRLGAAHVSLIDHSELALYEIDREIRENFPSSSATPILCSIRHRDRLRSVVAREKPQVIFHAAALKHVPMVELNPSESVLTNVLGTQNLIDAAKEAGVTKLVLISSDKAVAPSSLMGATKRLAEYLIGAQISKDLMACTVRFGNVLGSTGSVVPLFLSQIKKGGPLTITDAEAERFFMTIFEAVQLVLKAAKLNSQSAIDKSGLYVLEMGDPIRILDLAQRLMSLCQIASVSDFPVKFTGLRDGEKITEALLDNNEQRRALSDGIFEVIPNQIRPPLPDGSFDELYALARGGHDDRAKVRVFDMVRYLRMF